jgi:hypothetical protein
MCADYCEEEPPVEPLPDDEPLEEPLPDEPLDEPLAEELLTSPLLQAAIHSFWSIVVSPSGLAALKSLTKGAACVCVRPAPPDLLACCQRLVHSLWLSLVPPAADDGFAGFAVCARAPVVPRQNAAAAASMTCFMGILRIETLFFDYAQLGCA